MIDPGILAEIDQDQACAAEVIDAAIECHREQGITPGVTLAQVAAALAQEYDAKELALLLVSAIQRLAARPEGPDIVDLDRLLDVHDGLYGQETEQ